VAQGRRKRERDLERDVILSQPAQHLEERQVGLDDRLVEPVLLEKFVVLRMPHVRQVSVEDEGIGIPQSEQTRIFAKFYRAESSGRDLASGGTGLGLFMAKELLAAMHGRISVRSVEGEGSSFVFSLPLSTTPVLSERE